MNKLVILLIIIIIGGLAIYFLWPEEQEIEINSFEECLSAGYPVMESYPRKCQAPNGQVFTEDIGNELEKMDLIKIDNPRPNQEIESPISVKGEARGNWFFEASFPVKLFDDNGFLLAEKPAQALSNWMTDDFVEFRVDLAFSVPSTNKGELILEKDNPSGLPENDDQLIVPIVFKEIEPGETMTVNIFLSDSNFVNEPYFDCSRTKFVEREVPKTLAVGRASVEALLRGAKPEEIDNGLISQINPGVRLNSLTIEEGTAKADFTEQLEYQVGGSCRVTAIRAQIAETLKQFPTVDEVLITVNNREEVLQP